MNTSRRKEENEMKKMTRKTHMSIDIRGLVNHYRGRSMLEFAVVGRRFDVLKLAFMGRMKG